MNNTYILISREEIAENTILIRKNVLVSMRNFIS